MSIFDTLYHRSDETQLENILETIQNDIRTKVSTGNSKLQRTNDRYITKKEREKCKIIQK